MIGIKEKLVYQLKVSLWDHNSLLIGNSEWGKKRVGGSNHRHQILDSLDYQIHHWGWHLSQILMRLILQKFISHKPFHRIVHFCSGQNASFACYLGSSTDWGTQYWKLQFIRHFRDFGIEIFSESLLSSCILIYLLVKVRIKYRIG